MPKAALYALFVPLLFCSCGDKIAHNITFQYSYDKNKEILDTTNTGTDPWYLPIQKDFVAWQNANSERKDLIDPVTLNGIFWKPDHFLNRPLDFYEIPGETKYCVNIAAEGVGFEGYAIVNLVRFTKKGIQVDASYGSFSNNSDGNYASAFWQNGHSNKEFTDSIRRVDSAFLPPNGIGDEKTYSTQYYTADR